MRIRELIFNNFRAFRGETRISFVDPLTDAVQPVTVIAGTNGSGKTTILDTIEALLAYALDQDKPQELIMEAQRRSLICLTLELDPAELGQTGDAQMFVDSESQLLRIAVGEWELLPDDIKAEQHCLFGWLVDKDNFDKTGRPRKLHLFPGQKLADNLRETVSMMEQDQVKFQGGLLYFPHDRRLGKTNSGPTIEQPPKERRWLFRFSPYDQWQGSLEQLWVWQNYLDLEQSAEGRKNLKPFVELVENILGAGRKITIKEGRVSVTPSWDISNDTLNRVRLDQLPSGEQQCLLLFGELARRRRQGVVITLDEPEISLHPTLQRKLVHRLRQLARGLDGQLILATHSLEILRAVHESERVILDQLEEPALVYEEA